MQVRRYERNGYTLTVLPGATGCATIHDKDLWIYCISQLIEAANGGRDIAPTVRFTAFDFLTATQRDTSGRAYERMIEMLRRLKGTVVETSIETGGLRARRGFGLIEGWRVIEQSQDVGRMVAVEVDLPRWLFRSVQEKRVLTLSNAYFRLRKPLERRIYELARKHCGKQPFWRISLTVLHQKSGSTGALRRFRFEMKALAESGNLPDYLMVMDEKRDEDVFSWSEGIGFCIVDDQERIIWESTQYSPALKDLFDTAREQDSGINGIFDDLLGGYNLACLTCFFIWWFCIQRPLWVDFRHC